MQTSYNITVQIKPYVVDYASLYGISYNNLFNLAYENAAELINELIEIDPESIYNEPQGFLEGEDYVCTWQLHKDDNDKYIFTIIDITSDKAPEDSGAEEEIINAICNKKGK